MNKSFLKSVFTAYILLFGHLAFSFQEGSSQYSENIFSQADFSKAKETFRLHIEKLIARSDKPAATFFKCILDACNDDKWQAYKEKAGLTKSSVTVEFLAKAVLHSKKIGALAISAAMAHDRTTKWLISHGADFNNADSEGWTPAHFAAIQMDSSMLQLLKEYGANLDAKNNQNGTPKDLWRLTHNTPKSVQRVNFFDEVTGKVEAIDGFEYRKRTGADFTDHVVINPALLAAQWVSPPVLDENAHFRSQQPLSKLALEKYRASSPDNVVYIREIKQTDDKKPISGVGYGIFANTLIREGDLILEYEGEWLGTSNDSSAYSTQNIDAAHFRGYGGMSSDALPNVMMTGIYNEQGLKEREVMIAIREIKPGEGIYWDYRSDGVKVKFYSVIRPTQLEKDLPDVLRQLGSMKPTDTLTVNFDWLYRWQVGSYVLNTPIALLRLILTDKITTQDYQRLSRSKLAKHSFQFPYFKGYFDGLVAFSKSEPDLAQFVKQFLLNKLETSNVQTLFGIVKNLHGLLEQSKKVHANAVDSMGGSIQLSLNDFFQYRLESFWSEYEQHMKQLVAEQGL